MHSLVRILGAAALLAVLATPAFATAVINIINMDGPGEGLNDPTPVAPVGGNPGTTIGEQRLLCLQRAADVWGAALTSAVPISIEARFDPQPYCPTDMGLMGMAMNIKPIANHPALEFQGYWYPQALANQQAGVDLDPTTNDISAVFYDLACSRLIRHYYGFDLTNGTPGVLFTYSLVSLALHEFAHGLGFTSMTDPVTGEYFGSPANPLPGICDKFLYDEWTGLHWDQMTPVERVQSAVNSGALTWDVPDRSLPNGRVHHGALNFMAPILMGYAAEVLVPFGSGSMLGSIAQFGAPITEGGVSGQAVVVVDNVAPTGDGCQVITNAAALVGKIAVMDTPGNASNNLPICTRVTQANNAQAAGAIGIILVKPASDFTSAAGASLRGFDPAITIPVTCVSSVDGVALKTAIAGGPTNLTIRLSPTVIPGITPSGRVRMYAPGAATAGETASHFDGGAARDLLMDRVHGGLNGQTSLDLTPYYLEDIGWTIPRTTSVPADGPASRVTLASHPNPAHASASVHFELPGNETLQLTLYDVSGRQVCVLAKGAFAAGPHDLPWDGLDAAGRRVAPGVYMARLKGPRTQATHHLVLVN